MEKIDPTVKKETGYIALWVLIFSVFMQAVFLVIGKWNITVLFGNLLGGFTAVLNFFLLGITVQNAVRKDEKESKTLLKTSQIYRNLMVFVLAGLGVYFSRFSSVIIFNTWAVIIPLFFPRIAFSIRPLLSKKQG